MDQLLMFTSMRREDKLSALGDQLEKLNAAIKWEQFRSILEEAVYVEPKGPGGRKRYDSVMMFKILILERIYNLSDDQAEYQINDRISFMRFLGLGLSSNVPDSKTIWLFRETLVKAEAAEKLFKLFDRQLRASGLIANTGRIVDATFVEAPHQNIHRDEQEQLKNGKTPEEWQKPEKKHMLSQRDTDGRWAKKYNKSHFGYKDHIKIDAESKLILTYAVTPANVNDNQRFVQLLEEGDGEIYADCGYVGKDFVKAFPEGCISMVNEKGEINRPLTEEQKINNRIKSKTRARIEHVFGHIKVALHGCSIRCIGMARARFAVGLMNLTYNLTRCALLASRRAYAA